MNIRYCDDDEADERKRDQVGGHRNLLRKEACGMIAVWARIILGREPYPLGGRMRRVTMHAAGPGMFAHARPMM